MEGPAYIHLHQPCTTGWGYDPSKTIEMGRLAVETGSWILYEIENGNFKVTYRPLQRDPVDKYLTAQKRFKHLNEEERERIQNHVNAICTELKI
jgi:pyruvate ferredoxin oxidoreductase beta subunit